MKPSPWPGRLLWILPAVLATALILFLEWADMGETAAGNAMEALAAQAESDSVPPDWSQKYYQVFSKHHGTGNAHLGEEMTEALVTMLERHWDQSGPLLEQVSKDPAFKTYLLTDLEYDPVKAVVLKIHSSADRSCPKGLETLCQEIKTTISKNKSAE